MDKKTVTTISYLSRLKIDDEKEKKIINDLIVAKKIQLLLGADKALYFDGSVSITQQVTDALDGAAVAESETD